jgi:hypothetical protein
MNIREARDPAIRMVTPLNERLDRQYGVSINLCSPVEHLRSIHEHYVAKKDHMIHLLGESEAMKDPDYAKAVLISETVRLFLREIAPKRKRRTKR